MAGKREHGKSAGKLFRRPGASLQRCAHTGDVRSKTSRAASGQRLGCVTPPIGWAGGGNCCWEQLKVRRWEKQHSRSRAGMCESVAHPDISDKSDKLGRGELLAGKERAFVSRLGSQGRLGGRRGRLRGRAQGPLLWSL